MRVARRIMAVGALGVRALLVHPVQSLARRAESRGARRFLRNYAPEGLVPRRAEDEPLLPGFSRCVACGLCDQVCPLVGELPAFRGPSVVALAYTRATPDLPAAAATLERLPDSCGTCTACVAACPTRVPLRALFAYARRQLAQLDDARRPLPVLQGQPGPGPLRSDEAT